MGLEKEEKEKVVGTLPTLEGNETQRKEAKSKKDGN